LEKYNVEEMVDGEIRRVSQSIRRAVWNILQDVGWCALAQVGDVVGLVMAMMPAAGDDGGGRGGGEIISTQVQHDRQQENDDDDDDDDDDASGGDDDDDGDDAVKNDEEEEVSENEQIEKLELIELPTHHHNTITQPSDHDDDDEIKHISSYPSISSLRDSFGCYEDEDYLEDDNFTDNKSYLRDLTQMLQNGLYVFASYNKFKRGDDDADDDNDDDNDVYNTSNRTSTKSFRLSVFSYHPALSTSTTTTMDNDNKNLQQSFHDCFVFGPKPSRHTQVMTKSQQGEQMAKNSTILPVEDVVQVQKVGTHAIAFVTASSSSTTESQHRLQMSLQPTLTASFVSSSMLRTPSVCSNMSEEDFVTIMKSCSSIDNSGIGDIGGGNTLQHQQVVDDDDDEEEIIFAEMVFSNGEDRDTIFAGLKILLKNFDTHYGFDCDVGEEEDNDYENNMKEEIKGVGLDDPSEVEEDMNLEDELVEQLVDDNSPHSTNNKCEKEEQSEDSSPNIMLWEHGKMADDQVLGEEERNCGGSDSNHKSMNEHNDVVVDLNVSRNVKEISSLVDERLEDYMASMNDNDLTSDCSEDGSMKNGQDTKQSKIFQEDKDIQM